MFGANSLSRLPSQECFNCCSTERRWFEDRTAALRWAEHRATARENLEEGSILRLVSTAAREW